MKLKCISLWQPWASLIAEGIKRVETRGWKTNYRGLLGIHAAKTNKGWRVVQPEVLELFPPEVRRDVSLNSRHGALLGVVRLVDCRPMDKDAIAATSYTEKLVGDWAPGRWAWDLEQITKVDPPIPMLGQQGLFDREILDWPSDAQWDVVKAEMGLASP